MQLLPASPMLDPHALSAWIGLSTRTLKRMRRDGTGPEYVVVGNRIRYAESAVTVWLAGRARTCTSAHVSRTSHADAA